MGWTGRRGGPGLAAGTGPPPARRGMPVGWGRPGVRKEDGRLLPCFDRAHVGREGRCRDVTSGGKADMPRRLRTHGQEGAD